MIQLDYIDRANSTQTVPVVCMHCDSPTCAEVCPAHAIKRTGDGVVQSAMPCLYESIIGFMSPMGEKLKPRAPIP